MDTLPGLRQPAAPVEGDRLLRQARHDVHVTGWVLALEHAIDGAPLSLRGASESVLSPPLRSAAEGRAALGPSDLTSAGWALAARIPAHRPAGRAGAGRAL